MSDILLKSILQFHIFHMPITGRCLSNHQSQGFTFIELIVTMVIVATLATIGMMSYQGYSLTARDTTRSEDLANISRALGVYIASKSTLPAPDGGIPITGSGTALGSQGFA